MTRKDYVLIADAIKENILFDPKVKKEFRHNEDIDFNGLIYSLCWRLKADNNNFDADRFKDYIND